MLATLKRVVYDCSTTAAGDYDPARVIGYLIVSLGSLMYLVITATEYIVHHKWDGPAFTAGLTSIGLAMAAAAAGVWIKSTAEAPPVEKPTLPSVDTPAK